MRILIDGRLYGLENAGLGRYIINLVDQISKIDTNNEYVLLLREKYFDSLQLPANWKKVLADFRHYSFAEQFKLPGIINKEKPDLVHFPHFNVPILYCGKYVVTIHDMLMHNFAGISASTLPVPFYLLKQFAYRFTFRSAVSGAIKITVPSQTVKNSLVNHYHITNKKIEVIYEGFDEKILQDKFDGVKELYFVYIGNAYPHKNIQRLIDAIVKLNIGRKDLIRLAIASARNVFTEKLQKIVDEKKLGDIVKILGFVPDSQLGSLYKNSVAFVFPSLSEGFGLPGLEAMNSGTLLLASDIPVFKEIYSDNAKYFDSENVASIKEALEAAIRTSEKERNTRINKARSFVKRYSWAKMAEETLNIYLSLCGVASREKLCTPASSRSPS